MDVYSFGATFYRLLCASKPHEGRSAMQILQHKLIDDAMNEDNLLPAFRAASNADENSARCAKARQLVAVMRCLQHEPEAAADGISVLQLLLREVARSCQRSLWHRCPLPPASLADASSAAAVVHLELLANLTRNESETKLSAKQQRISRANESQNARRRRCDDFSVARSPPRDEPKRKSNQSTTANNRFINGAASPFRREAAVKRRRAEYRIAAPCRGQAALHRPAARDPADT
jgi:hypothetical protein